MTAVSFYSVTASAEPVRACRLVRQFDVRRMLLARVAASRRRDGFSTGEESARRSPSLLESQAHQWRAPVRQTLKSHRNGQRWSHRAVASSCLQPSRAVSCWLRPSSTVPVMWVLPARALRATSAEHGPRRPEAVRGVWRLIATTNGLTLRPVARGCQVGGATDGRRNRGAQQRETQVGAQQCVQRVVAS
jgi:hypothetical protein